MKMKDTFILSFKAIEAVSGFPLVHDPSAVIAKNGSIIAGVEEERFVRIKHATNMFPAQSIKFCLEKANIDFSDIMKIIIPDDPDAFRKDFLNIRNLRGIRHRLQLQTRYRQDMPQSGSFFQFITNSKKCKNIILYQLKKNFGERNYPPIEFMGHHLCHAASCYYPSGFEDASVITIDGSGDYDSTVIWSGADNELVRKSAYKLDNSLGHFYGAFTVFLGYQFCDGESKIMGLAPYGEKNKDMFDIFNHIIKIDSEGYDVRQISLPMLYDTAIAIKKIEELFGIKPRLPHEEFTKAHKDLAYAAQYFLEQIAQNLIQHAINITGSPNVCLAGGVALNCKMNKKIMEMPEVKKLFIQPVAHDAGGPLGAVLEESKKLGFPVQFMMQHTYFGPCYDDKLIPSVLEKYTVDYHKIDSYQPIAQSLANGKFVGWFQEKMEMGPRALGNRSIICDPRRNDLKDRLNECVKHREKWRPFAPSILEDYAENYIENYSISPFMIKTFDVKKEKQKDLEGVVHPADGTTRPHIVSREINPQYYDLITEFMKITGIPLLLNTSFNDHGEPIVCSPKDALQTFYTTGLDVLVLNNYMIVKE